MLVIDEIFSNSIPYLHFLSLSLLVITPSSIFTLLDAPLASTFFPHNNSMLNIFKPNKVETLILHLSQTSWLHDLPRRGQIHTTPHYETCLTFTPSKSWPSLSVNQRKVLAAAKLIWHQLLLSNSITRSRSFLTPQIVPLYPQFSPNSSEGRFLRPQS